MQTKALLVIDIQEDYTGTTAKPPFPYKTSERLIAIVNKIIDEASKKNIFVVYITQEFDGFFGKMFSKVFCGGTAVKGNPGTKIDKRINVISDYFFSKPLPDAFSNPKLREFLNENKVNELYLVGLDAAYCVNATAMGAINRGYKVGIITDGIATRKENRLHEILKKYEQNGITLLSSEGFKNISI